jgi:hypothetical protein
MSKLATRQILLKNSGEGNLSGTDFCGIIMWLVDRKSVIYVSPRIPVSV